VAAQWTALGTITDGAGYDQPLAVRPRFAGTKYAPHGALPFAVLQWRATSGHADPVKDQGMCRYRPVQFSQELRARKALPLQVQDVLIHTGVRQLIHR
jgi:hypothetical protein